MARFRKRPVVIEAVQYWMPPGNPGEIMQLLEGNAWRQDDDGNHDRNT